MIEKKIINILSNYTSVPVGNILSSHHLNDDLGITSVKIVNFIMDIEEEFEIEMDMSKITAAAFSTVQSITSIITSMEV